MRFFRYKYSFQILLIAVFVFAGVGCQKTTTAPDISGVASLTVVNAIPNTYRIIPVINTSQAIMWFGSARTIQYGNFFEYSPISGNDTIYVIGGANYDSIGNQYEDTLNVGPKYPNLYNNILPLKKGTVYSLFLCGSDTSSVDYLFTKDTLPYHGPSDSTLGIRFVNLSAGSNPISVNLEGSANGSEAANLAYKSITSFTSYSANSSVSSYQFVFRDAATGDSLTQFKLTSRALGIFSWSLSDPNNNTPLRFKNVTLALYGSETPGSNTPLKVTLIDNY